MTMKLLLCKTIAHLGIVGDVVEVAPGYGRNYLVPQGLATTPTEANVRALAEARRLAEAEQIRQRKHLESIAERLEGAEVTIRAKANEDGVLYGSVGAKEIADALIEEGYPVVPERIVLPSPLRQLDNVPIEIKLGDDLRCTVKVWVVRDKTDGEDEETVDGPDGAEAGTEAAADEHHGSTE